MAKFAIADAQKQQQIQQQQEESGPATVSSESITATAFADQDQRKTEVWVCFKRQCFQTLRTHLGYLQRIKKLPCPLYFVVMTMKSTAKMLLPRRVSPVTYLLCGFVLYPLVFTSQCRIGMSGWACHFLDFSKLFQFIFLAWCLVDVSLY